MEPAGGKAGCGQRAWCAWDRGVPPRRNHKPQMDILYCLATLLLLPTELALVLIEARILYPRSSHLLPISLILQGIQKSSGKGSPASPDQSQKLTCAHILDCPSCDDGIMCPSLCSGTHPLPPSWTLPCGPPPPLHRACPVHKHTLASFESWSRH